MYSIKQNTKSIQYNLHQKWSKGAPVSGSFPLLKTHTNCIHFTLKLYHLLTNLHFRKCNVYRPKGSSCLNLLLRPTPTKDKDYFSPFTQSPQPQAKMKPKRQKRLEQISELYLMNQINQRKKRSKANKLHYITPPSSTSSCNLCKNLLWLSFFSPGLCEKL